MLSTLLCFAAPAPAYHTGQAGTAAAAGLQRACGSTLGPGTATKALTGAPLGPAGLPENLVGGIASVMFQLPIARHNYAWAGCMPAGARSRTRARRLVCGGVRVLEGAWQIAQSCRRVCGGC